MLLGKSSDNSMREIQYLTCKIQKQTEHLNKGTQFSLKQLCRSNQQNDLKEKKWRRVDGQTDQPSDLKSHVLVTKIVKRRD